MLPKQLQAFPGINESIAYSRTLQLVSFKNKNITAFSLRFNPKHAYSITSGRYMRARLTLFENYSQNKWNARTEPFWCTCIARKENEHNKSTVRGWMARRVRGAVMESMKKAGFRPDGTSLDGKVDRKLYGTAQFTPEAAILKMPYTEVVRQTDVAVEKMMELRAGRMGKAKKFVRKVNYMDAASKYQKRLAERPTF